MPIAVLPMSDEVAARLSGTPLLLLLDIDGTIAPIAPRPADVSVPPAMTRTLETLARTEGVRLAIVSGRSVADSRRIVPIAAAWFVGNHGFEIAAPGEPADVVDGAAAYEASVAAAASRVAHLADAVPGVILENKRWTLSAHYRLASRDAVPELSRRITKIARELGLVVTTGKEVLELRPPVRVDKGIAAVQVAERLGAFREGASILCAGDDVTDEDMFTSVRQRAPRSLTIAVGQSAATRESNAEFCVESPDAMLEILSALAVARGRAPSD